MRKALSRDDLFTVGIEVAMTDTMAFADVVLPACTHFEHADLYPAYGQQYLQRAEPVIPAVGESLPNTEIFRRLAARFGFGDPAFTASDAELMDAAMNADDPRLKGRRPSQLPLDSALKMEYGGVEPVLCDTVWPRTPSGRIERVSETLRAPHGAPPPAFRPLESSYPPTLITPAPDQRLTSPIRGLPAGHWHP